VVLIVPRKKSQSLKRTGHGTPKGGRSRFNRASRRDALDSCGLLEQEARRLNSTAGGIDTSDNVSAKGTGVGIFFRKIDHLAARIRAFSLFFQQHNPGQMPS
jgi:hypothetical protein